MSKNTENKLLNTTSNTQELSQIFGAWKKFLKVKDSDWEKGGDVLYLVTQRLIENKKNFFGFPVHLYVERSGTYVSIYADISRILEKLKMSVRMDTNKFNGKLVKTASDWIVSSLVEGCEKYLSSSGAYEIQVNPLSIRRVDDQIDYANIKQVVMAINLEFDFEDDFLKGVTGYSYKFFLFDKPIKLISEGTYMDMWPFKRASKHEITVIEHNKKTEILKVLELL